MEQIERPKMDWTQVSLNGGPPCFAVGIDGDPLRYCDRAEKWEGHGHDHEYISLERLLDARPSPWHPTNTMPPFDGQYLCWINEPQECGNVWHYSKVLAVHNNEWVVDSDRRTVIAWQTIEPYTAEGE